MPFRFKMQKILDYRQQQEEQAKVRLAQAQNAHDQELARLQATLAELAEKQGQLATRLIEDNGERWLLENFIKGLRADAAASQARLKALGQALDAARKFLQEKALEHKVLDKLRERQQANYLRDEREKELKANDETATLRCKASTF